MITKRPLAWTSARGVRHLASALRIYAAPAARLGSLAVVGCALVGCSANARYTQPSAFLSGSLEYTHQSVYQRPIVQSGQLDPAALPSGSPEAPGATGVAARASDGPTRVARTRSRARTRARDAGAPPASGATVHRTSTPPALSDEPQRRASGTRVEEHTVQRGDRGHYAAPSAAYVPRSNDPADSDELAYAAPSATGPTVEIRRVDPEARDNRSPHAYNRNSATPSSAPTQLPGLPLTSNDALDYVRAVYELNGVSFEANASLRVVDIYRSVQRDGQIYHAVRPVVGDLVFFHNTADANGDGRNNDWYSHVGIVEDVDAGGVHGRVRFLSYRDGRVASAYLDLAAPTISGDASEPTNSTLRARRSSDPEYTQYLAGELFAGFGSLLGANPEFLVLDEWQPSTEAQHAIR